MGANGRVAGKRVRRQPTFSEFFCSSVFELSSANFQQIGQKTQAKSGTLLCILLRLSNRGENGPAPGATRLREYIVVQASGDTRLSGGTGRVAHSPIRPRLWRLL